MTEELRRFIRTLYREAHTIPLTENITIKFFQDIVIFAGALVLPILGVIFALAVGSELGQIGFKISPKKFTEGLNFKKIFNPLPGLKKLLISQQTMVELTKNLLKVIIIGGIIYNVLQNKLERLHDLMMLPFFEIGRFMADVGYEMIYKVGIAYLLIAAADYFYQKYKFAEDMKMTKQEVKDENKQSEGDMQSKARLRSIGRERIKNLLTAKMQEADVVVTNPTHFAVALSYKPGMSSPCVVAKGIDFMALRIREIATDIDVPIMENRPLARTLYKNVGVDQEIPESLYKAVAEVLAVVYKMKQEKQKK
jgi:flagellar biosynthetic protein FlhB